MGRPEPCVLFAQTFVHPHLDEYVDEVLFAEPIVITACEFLEQNVSFASQAVTLLGATSPPSFALEVFVQCEGETKFRRLCQPFLYSPSSSNVLEVEAVVTNHLVVRGSYRSLSLVIYGNTAEDLGQFNIEFDDSSITNLVSSAVGKLEDLPLALHSTNLTIEDSISALSTLCLPVVASDISVEANQLLQLMLKVCELPNLGDALHNIVSTVVSAATSYVTCSWGRSSDCEELNNVLSEARTELIELYKVYKQELRNALGESLADSGLFESEADLVNSKQLVDVLSQYFCFNRDFVSDGHHQLPQNTNVMLGLSVALLLCSGRESCFHFVSGGGMEQLVHVFCRDEQISTATTLLLLGVVEKATQHSFGCEGFLGWWPREDENKLSGVSDGYSKLLNLLLQKQRHDVASCATYVLHRLRFYEVASRFECAVLSVLGGLSTVGRVTSDTLDMLICAKSQLKKLLKLINSRGPIEDPSPVARATKSLILGQTEGVLSYKASNNLITASNCCFSNWDIDLHLLDLLKERGFLPLSVAILSSSILRSEVGRAMDVFVDIASSIGAILLSLLFCRSGLIFLLHHPELSATIIHALRGANNVNKDACLPLRYASVSISKGFFCAPQEVGMIVGTHLRVVNAIDRLLTASPNSEEFLWVLWELCALARSDCGRQALLALGYFPEAVKILIEALHSAKEQEPVAKNSGASPLNIAIFHSAAEIFEVIVSDSTASSLGSWIGHVMELHRALHSSSPGSNRKDAPTRLLEWIDAGVIYHKNGATGLIRYAAVLASGGDAHLTSTIPLVSDLADVENVIGDSSGGSDANVMENLGKFISDKSFDGVILRDSSVAQLTTAFRILAFISENSTVAATLYDEGVIAIIYAVLVNCRFMLERSSNSYDYLVDEGTECNSTSDLLSERNREQSLVDLVVPTLVLLINLLQKLKEVQEQHRNTKLLNVLLRLHREVSPKLAACAADLSSPYPDSALGFGAICHLLVSALACWPVYGWTPGLFDSLLANVQVTSLLALGPKETCSLLCLLNDLFPEEGVWIWKNGMPLLSALRKLSVGTVLGPQKEREVNWYLHPVHLEKLLSQLMPHLDKVAQIIQHYAISALVVIQDMLRVFIIRIACQKAESCSILLRPIFSWILDHAYDFSSPSDVDAYKVYRYLDFLASLLEHPRAKALLLKEGVIQMLTRVLDRCLAATDTDRVEILDGRSSAKFEFGLLNWSLPVFKSFSLIFTSQASLHHAGENDLHKFENLSTEDCTIILKYLLRFFQVLPVGKELLACLTAFKELGYCSEGRRALAATFDCVSSVVDDREKDGNGNYSLPNEYEWRKSPPLLCCCKNLLRSVDSKDGLSSYTIEAVNALSMGSFSFCLDGERLNPDRVVAVKFLFGIPDDIGEEDSVPHENLSYIRELTSMLKTIAADHVADSDTQTPLYQVLESVKSLILLLQKPSSSLKLDDVFSSDFVPLPLNIIVSSKIHIMSDGGAEMADDYLYQGALGDKFQWECPETLPDRLAQSNLSVKRKMPSLDGPNRRARGENSPAETPNQNVFSRGLGSTTASSGPTRRDTFRQRKPNTSRPPSMHVDDYVARERNDGVSNSNVIAVQRVGSTGGRPPSIHVDEFMARQRERQNPVSPVVGDAAVQVKSATPVNNTATEKFNRPKQLKADLDDDLHGIDIVFDGEESEPDDKLPFPQPDDNLQQPAPVVVEQSSPHSIVAETESDIHDLATPSASNMDENTQSEFSSRMSVSRPEIPLTREPSVTSDKKYYEHSDDPKNATLLRTSSGFDSATAANSPRFPVFAYNNSSASSVQLPVDSRMTPQNFFPKNSPQHAGNAPVASGSPGFYDQRFLPNQPPLPPMPPPSTAVISQTSESVPSQSSLFVNSLTDVQQQLPTAFQIRSDYLSAFNNGSTSSRNSVSSPNGAARPPPPLPPTPPPFSSSPYNLTSNRTISQSSVYNQTSVGANELPQSSTAPSNDARLGGLSASGARVNTYSPPSLVPHMVFRPGSNSMSLYGSLPTQLQGDNASILQNLSIPQAIHSLAQLQPLQPPQLPRPPQPPQHLRPPLQASQQLEQGVSLQSQVQMHHPLQILQQPQVSPMHAYYQSQQQEFVHVQQQQQVDHSQLQAMHQSGDASSQQQQDPGMSLHEYFKSPEAIQSLLSDRDKLCQLLEQHPKLMQMLQEKLGQL
ncbi:PREDICTED: embryo defective 2016 [Prunus dulcis]|uniref:PREDICTED: embryo defective 2016 n=1 Tax=Prunus dulcis TaxID=3755 RepID=A0A5E4EK33_PRUDU|nr:protein virilizer homolog isoform X1 [Prunus dulcis]VVA15380.1 PREDICTED: embryo defective 2016 [Prunus dulcis]